MCYGTQLNNGQRCHHENYDGECLKPRNIDCPMGAEYCETCGTFFGEDNPCECERD